MENIYLPIVILSNGLRVANFNSPHAFNFEDGSILPAVPNSVATSTMLDYQDVETFNGVFIDVAKKFVISEGCIDRIQYVLKFKDLYDVCLVPLPVLSALREIDAFPSAQQKFRTIYVTDRITKAISISKFCK